MTLSDATILWKRVPYLPKIPQTKMTSAFWNSDFQSEIKTTAAIVRQNYVEILKHLPHFTT